jgi:murein DD-endopeptidase MepM/ murein hydrolase activator NlpD
VPLPARRLVRFRADQPSAFSYRLALRRGQRLGAFAAASSSSPTTTFVDVFEADAVDASHRDGGIGAAEYEADDDREVIVRVQPELLRDGRLVITLRAEPALLFPVASARLVDLQSVFGDPRDAGRRRHEGVDIFATRGTPVVAASDGIVTRVTETRIGGRVVWLWDLRRSLTLYYAHLDEQHVTAGERVRAGEVIGTVGNTGNARTTPPHLHFGIYERGLGAIDPYWFVAPAEVAASASNQ